MVYECFYIVAFGRSMQQYEVDIDSASVGTYIVDLDSYGEDADLMEYQWVYYHFLDFYIFTTLSDLTYFKYYSKRSLNC